MPWHSSISYQESVVLRAEFVEGHIQRSLSEYRLCL
jgi:hypothetical protein